MKKVTYLVAVAALGIMSCSGNKSGYVVTGTVEGAADGDTVFMRNRVNREYINTDTAIIANGVFTFEGVQDSAVNRYVAYGQDEKVQMVDFFLENGKTTVNLTKENKNNLIAGTANNDAYQEVKNQLTSIGAKEDAIYEAMADSTLTDELKDAKKAELGNLETERTNAMKASIEKNITNPVGIFLLSRYNFMLDYTALESLLSQVSANYQNNEEILRIKDIVELGKKTAVGQKFTDFEMQDPQGKAIKLSDYVGKGKVVLIDFWASWCPPCREEMPGLVAAYAKHKGENFEIVGVSLDRDATAWKAGLKKMNMTWPQMSDLKFWNSEGAKLYAVRSIPHTVLVDGEGTIIARGLHGEELQSKITEALKK